jgi:hypothetical protein
MTFKSEQFRQYYLRQGSPNSASSHSSNLRKADQFCGGMDEKIEEMGAEGFVRWAESQSSGPFQGANATNVRSAIRKYVSFTRQASPGEDTGLDQIAEVEESLSSAVFRYEQELQAAVRKQIGSIEQGLTIADSGNERVVSTGRIDVLARDSDGAFVIIELKAGLCPKGAIEQALGYAADIDEEEGATRPSRVILIAGDFSERMLSAAKRINGLDLLRYSVALSFSKAV